MKQILTLAVVTVSSVSLAQKDETIRVKTPSECYGYGKDTDLVKIKTRLNGKVTRIYKNNKSEVREDDRYLVIFCARKKCLAYNAVRDGEELFELWDIALDPPQFVPPSKTRFNFVSGHIEVDGKSKAVTYSVNHDVGEYVEIVNSQGKCP